MAKKKKTSKKIEKRNQTIFNYVLAIVAIVIMILAYFRMGIFGIFLYNLARYLFGDFYYVLFIASVIIAIIILVNKKQGAIEKRVTIAIVLFLLALFLYGAQGCDKELVGFNVISNFIGHTKDYFATNSELSAYGGVIGALLFSLSTLLFARDGTFIVMIALILIGIILLCSTEIAKTCWEKLKESFKLPEPDVDDQEEEEEYFYDDNEDSKDDEETSFDTPTKATMLGKLDDKEKKSIFVNADEGPVSDDLVDFNETEEVDHTSIMKSIPTVDAETESSTQTTSTTKSSKPNASEIKNYRLPPFSLLNPLVAKQKSSVNTSSAKEKGQRLMEILNNFGIEAELVATHIGPAVTKFEVKPDSSVKVNKISSIQDNIKMELAARDIRIEAPIPGKTAVGIEIPNVEPTAVKMIELVKNIPPLKKDNKLLFILGKDLMGNPVYCELNRMPHLLIAGQTGSGKSVCMNTIISSFLLRCRPDEVKLLLVDPKKVEFTPFQNIPHLIAPVISDAAEASNALKVIVNIMEQRYDIFSKCAVRNIQGYNDLIKTNPSEGLEPMPYIVVIIDELADLMAVAGKEVELSIQRITQLARAAGIHLIVATQRPSTDVITGIIKANIPSRIAFSVASGIDSRTILDHIGAERLLGNGDMLYFPTGDASPTRLQGVYVTDDEVRKIAQYCEKQCAPFYDDAFVRLEGVNDIDGNLSVVKAEDDPLYDEVKDFVVDSQKASTSLLQRRFGIGYNRAARMIDVLEQRGVIGPANGSKPRDVYIKKDE